MQKSGALSSIVQALTTKKSPSMGELPTYVCSPEFKKFLFFLNNLEQERIKNEEAELRANYMLWASCFEMLKVEFSKLWSFFESIEKETNGWHCVSPSLAKWGALGHSSGGYNFSACIMKNFDRDAPNSEKSLTVTFAFDSLTDGMGDEMSIGRKTEVDERLVGLEQLKPDDVNRQLEEVRRMANFCLNSKISFRLNHKLYGQESTKLDVNILKEHSLVSLAEKLFMALNNDILLSFNKVLHKSEQRLYLHNQ